MRFFSNKDFSYYLPYLCAALFTTVEEGVDPVTEMFVRETLDRGIPFNPLSGPTSLIYVIDDDGPQISIRSHVLHCSEVVFEDTDDLMGLIDTLDPEQDLLGLFKINPVSRCISYRVTSNDPRRRMGAV